MLDDIDNQPTLGDQRQVYASIEAALGELGLGIGVWQGEQLLYANDALGEILGYSREALLDRDVTTLVNTRDLQALLERHRQRLAGKDVPSRYVVTVDHAEGHPLELDISTVVIPGDSPSVLIVVRDITEERIDERRLMQSHKMQAIGELATGIAHDFNNYLTALRLTAEELEEWVSEPSGRELIEELMQLTVGAARLSRQLLAFGGRDVGEPTVLDVNVAIFETAAMLERLIGERMQLVTRLEPGVPPVKADEGQFQQILVNLIMNARDALDDGGHIVVRSSAGEEGWVRVEVTDDGSGMECDVLDRAFEPYFSTKSDEHTGMGLAIVYGVIQHLSGRVEIDSEPGKGTTVIVELRAEKDPFTATPVDEDAETILLVEDEVTLRQLLTAGLRRHGYRVIAVADGDEAMRSIAGDHHLDTLVTDMVIPGASGKLVVEEFRASRPDAAVVVISGYSDSLDADFVDSDAMVFLRKPFSAVDLVDAIERAAKHGE